MRRSAVLDSFPASNTSQPLKVVGHYSKILPSDIIETLLFLAFLESWGDYLSPLEKSCYKMHSFWNTSCREIWRMYCISFHFRLSTSMNHFGRGKDLIVSVEPNLKLIWYTLYYSSVPITWVGYIKRAGTNSYEIAEWSFFEIS